MNEIILRIRIFLLMLLLSLVYNILVLPETVSAFSDGSAAIDLIGQYVENDGVTPDYTSSQANDTPSLYGLKNAGIASAIDSVGHRLFVPDFQNHRVLVFNLNSSNQLVDKAPDYVLGQSTFYTNTATTTQSGMMSPTSVAYDSANQRLFVAQSTSQRVTVYDVASITNGENAINVLGQSSFTASTATTTQSGMNGPMGLSYDSTNQRLFVAETTNHRVIVYDVASITNGENAVSVLGQSSFTTSASANTQAGMNNPRGVAYDSTNQRLFVSQIGNNRVTVYAATSTISNGAPALSVLGQSTFTGTAAATTQAGMSSPRGIAYDAAGQRLFVAGNGNHRVTVYAATSTISNGAPAINVIGQSNFTNGSAANTQSGLNSPVGLSYDDTNNRLYIAEENGDRMSIHNVATSTISDGANAIDLIGQYMENDGVTPDYLGSSDNDGPGLYGLSYVSNGSDIDLVNHRLFVVDPINYRVLVFNLNSSNQLVDKTPDYVLGQSTFYTNTSTTTQSGMNFPLGATYDSANQRLFVADASNNRVIVYDVASITNGENAVSVLGQSSFTTSSSATTQSGMSSPVSMAYDSANQRLFVAQSANHRVTVYDVASITNGENAINVLGQTTFTGATSTASQSGMSSPVGLAYDSANQSLFVAQSANHRVTVYDVASITNGENAINVLGQSSFTGATSATTQSRLASPQGLAYDSTNQRLFVSDANNNRVVVYAVDSITDGEPAVNVLGKETYTSSSQNITQAGMSSPASLIHDSTNQRLYVGQGINRISIFEVAPILVELSTSTSISVSESGTSTFAQLLVHGTTTATSTIDLDITGGTATIVTDFTSSDPITITIPPGVYDGSSTTAISITPPTLLSDSVVETGGETIIFTLNNPNNAIIDDADSDMTTQSVLTYTIPDDPISVASSTNNSLDIVTSSRTAASAPNLSPAELMAIFGNKVYQPPSISSQTVYDFPGSVINSGLKIYGLYSIRKKSSEVRIIQKLLNADPVTIVATSGPGSAGLETEYFGPATRSAVQKFQLKYNIVSSQKDSGYGIFGPKTRSKMNELLKKKSE